MKLTKTEFEAQLALAKSLTGDAKKSMIETLRAASVVEVDAKGVETPITIEIQDISPEAQKELQHAKGMDAEQTKTLIAQAIADAMKAYAPKANVQQPESKFVLPKGVRRVGTLKSFRGEVNGLKADERAYRFGQWARACMGIESAKAFCDDNGISVKLHSEGTNSSGGYLFPEEFGTDLINLREQYGVVRKVFKIRPMSSDTRTDPRRVSGLTASFVGEGTAGTESTTGWDQVRLTAKKLMVLSRISNELNEDAIINIGDDLASEISYAFALKEDQCGFAGDGTATYAGIQGIPSKLIAVNGVDEGGGIVLASGNLFSEFVLADFNRVVGRIPQYADNPNTAWVAHRSFYYGTMQRLELAAGGVTAVEVREGNRVPQFLGYPVQISQVMPSADVNSQVACTLGDHSAAASFGDRKQETITFSTDATIGGESVFERDEIAVRGTERFDINVHDVGSATVAGPVVGLISAAS